jgi:hypothetical protein
VERQGDGGKSDEREGDERRGRGGARRAQSSDKIPLGVFKQTAFVRLNSLEFKRAERREEGGEAKAKPVSQPPEATTTKTKSSQADRARDSVNMSQTIEVDRSLMGEAKQQIETHRKGIGGDLAISRMQERWLLFDVGSRFQKRTWNF